MASSGRTIRCTIYTRKSSEEGLEQDFNSLDAQREACEAYIKSQKHAGWEAISQKYDDGGYSGGTLEHPALDALLSDIRQKKVDVVVVYKIDRLTRSLFDFSKIVEIFDAGGVSFVSVTQQFNTTTSMGRLTLNVLLSFAQFEREVTGERIRDKIAASKKKGMWMGGCVPLGYRVEKRELVIDAPEAQHVRTVYEKYLEFGSVRAAKDAVDALGITSRPTSRTSGSLLGRGHICRILTNPIYMGKISHKGILSDGQHQPIIEPKVWQKVQEMLQANNARERDQPNATVSSPLAGIIFDEQGERLTPSHAVKSGRRYRYYISNVLVREPGNTSGIRLSAPEIEAAVCQMIQGLLRDPQQSASLIAAPDPSPSEIKEFVDRAKTFVDSIARKPPYEQLVGLKPALARIVIGTQHITLSLKRSALETIVRDAPGRQPHGELIAVAHAADDFLTISLPIRVGRRGRETRIILQSGQTRQRPVTKPGRYADGGNLYLQISENGGKRWVFAYRFGPNKPGAKHNRYEMGLGSAAKGQVALADAREKALAARQLLAAGKNPISERDADAKALKVIPTFGDFADDYIAAHRPKFRNEKHAAQWEMTLGDAYCRAIRGLPVNAIDTEAVLKVLQPIWTKVPETASRLRGRIENVLDAARARGFRDGPNPATWRGHLKTLLPARQRLTRGHHAALPYDDLATFMADLRARKSTAALALELCILTATRSGEVLNAEWREFDLGKGVWTVPATRMKAGHEHRIPLTKRTLEILKSLPKHPHNPHVFPGHAKGKPLSGMAMTMQLRRMKRGEITVQGFRSTFRDWASEQTSFPHETCEHALAHRISDKAEAAYRRGDQFDKRRKLMEAWTAFCESKEAGQAVELE